MMGNTSRVSTVAVIKPPITIMASGFCVSEPTPWEMAAGIKPIAAIMAVITTGRTRDSTPVRIASFSGMPASRFLWNTDINITPFCIQIPNSAMKPTPAEIPKLIPVT